MNIEKHMDSWEQYKQNIIITRESNESFDWIEDIFIRDLFNYIRNILNNSPGLRNKIRTSNGTNLLSLIPKNNRYPDILLDRVLHSYYYLLQDWNLWTKIFKENIMLKKYLNKQYTETALDKLYETHKNINTTHKYHAEQYNIDVNSYLNIIKLIYFERKNKLPPFLCPCKSGSIKFPGYIRLVLR